MQTTSDRQKLVTYLKHLNNYSLKSYLITLTYEPEQIPTDRKNNKELKKVHLYKYLEKLQDLHKRRSKTELKYYAVGEIGNKTKNPHFHILLLGNPMVSKSEIQNNWYNTELKKIYGLVDIQKCTNAAIQYLTREDKNRHFKIFSK